MFSWFVHYLSCPFNGLQGLVGGEEGAGGSRGRGAEGCKGTRKKERREVALALLCSLRQATALSGP